MKTKLLLIFAVAILLSTLAVFGQSTNAPPVRKLVIATLPSTNLNCVSLECSIQDVTYDPTTYVPIFTFLIEAYGEDVNAGITNRFIVAKKTLTTTTAQSKSYVAAADPKQFLTTALLNKAGLQPKP